MEFRQLNTFIQVAKFQSFSKAAEHLGYSQSAVTVQIRMLEKELNTRLFDRMGKKILLTSQGQEFLVEIFNRRFPETFRIYEKDLYQRTEGGSHNGSFYFV